MFEQLDISHRSPEREYDILGDDENESYKSGTLIMEAPSGDDNKNQNERPKKKPFRRHTQHQIQEMEDFFIDSLIPNDKQLQELRELAPSQMKCDNMFQQNMFNTHHLLCMAYKNPEKEFDTLIDVENQSNKSGTDILEAPSGDYYQDPNKWGKKKPYQCNTLLQIQEMEAFFNECSNPNDHQMQELASRLSMAPSLVKSWFQNKRSFMKFDSLFQRNMLDITESPSGGNYQDQNWRPIMKPYHRHTQHQIQELEAFFNVCPNPNNEQRLELGARLSLSRRQVRNWFQNKRIQMKLVKGRDVRDENFKLRAEIEMLRADNIRYREALANAACPYCGCPAAFGEMSSGGQHFRTMANYVPSFRQETTDVGTPEEAWMTTDLEFGRSEGFPTQNTATVEWEETRNSNAPPVTSHRPPAL